MNPTCSGNCRRLFTAGALCAELLHLGWEHTHGGVIAHHLLGNPELPAFSNWWGVLLIPFLAWWLVGRIGASVQARTDELIRGRRGMRINPWGGFAVALVYGAAMAIEFSTGSSLVSWLFFALPVLALVIRLWQAQYVLGFVFGMTFVFGAVLPTIIASVIAMLSWTVHAVASALRRRLRSPGGLA